MTSSTGSGGFIRTLSLVLLNLYLGAKQVKASNFIGWAWNYDLKFVLDPDPDPDLEPSIFIIKVSLLG